MRKDRQLLTLQETCNLLRVSHEAIAKFVRLPQDPLPALRAGRRWLFRQEAVLRWCERQGKRAQTRQRRAALV